MAKKLSTSTKAASRYNKMIVPLKELCQIF